MFITVGADPCVRPGNVNRVYRTIRLYRDKCTYNSAHKKRLELNVLFLFYGRTRGSAPTVVKEKQLPPPPSRHKCRATSPKAKALGEALKECLFLQY